MCRLLSASHLDAVHGLLQLLELVAYLLEAGHHLIALVDAVAVFANLALRGVYLQSFFLNQIVDFAYHFYVGWSVEARVFGVAARIDDGELLLPVAQCGFWNVENFGHIANLIKPFVEFVHLSP